MTARGTALRLLTLALAIAAVLLVLGSVLGQPVFLSYVETGSMAPALEPGDGFVAIPAALAGPVGEGDVVVFRAERLHGGGLTTHRVVEETPRGFVTKGDANPFTDQSGEEPPVKRAQVVAVALQVNGEVVAVPHLGAAVEGVAGVLAAVQRELSALFGGGFFLGAQGLAYLFFAVTLLWFLLGEYRDGGGRASERNAGRSAGIDPRLVVAAFALLLVAGTTAAMVGPAGTQQYDVVSADFDSDRPGVIPTGTSESVTYAVGNAGVLPVVVYLEPASEGIAVAPREAHVPPDDVVNATVTLSAPPQTGHYRRFLVQHRYLAVLPQSAIRSLYGIHPWAPIVAIDALVAGGFLALSLPFVGTGRLRARSTDRPGRWRRRAKRLLSKTGLLS